jgi:hypothetical protein
VFDRKAKIFCSIILHNKNYQQIKTRDAYCIEEKDTKVPEECYEDSESNQKK